MRKLCISKIAITTTVFYIMLKEELQLLQQPYLIVTL